MCVGTLKMVTVQKEGRKERKQKAGVSQSGAYFSGPHLLSHCIVSFTKCTEKTALSQRIQETKTQCKDYISGLTHLVRHQRHNIFQAMLLYVTDFELLFQALIDFHSFL